MENRSNTSIEDDEDEYIFAEPRIQAAFILLYSVVFFFCFFGNLTVVLVMRLHWKMRGSTKFCLGNLAFANLCVGTFCVYQDLFMYLIDSWVFGKFLCKMHHFTNNLAHTASILILVVIAVERYFAILDPFKCRRVFTTRRLRLVILGVWIVSALICSPRWYYTVTVTNPLPGRDGEPVRYEVICTLLLSIYDSSTAAVIQFLLLFLIPMIIISILYTKIGLFLQHRETFVCSFVQTSAGSDTDSGQTIPLRDSSRRNSGFENLSRKVSFPMEVQLEKIQERSHYSTCVEHALLTTSTCSGCSLRGNRANYRSRCDSVRRAAAALNRQGSTVSSSSYVHARVRRNSSVVSTVQSPHKGVVRMLVTIVITFALCNFPLHLRKLYQIFYPNKGSDSVWSELATPLSFLLMYANCAINPMLYAFMSQNFRSCFMDCLRCQFRKPSQSGGSNQ